MKKILGATLALMMGATCAIGFTACGGDDDNDASKAKDAITMVSSQYSGDPKETSTDYDLFGQVKVGDSMVKVDWSVSSSVNNISDYVKVGEMNAETTLVTVSITPADKAIEYKLKASVTVGKATESVEFDRVIPVQEKVYSIAEINNLGKDLAQGTYYEENGAAVKVLVKGYVVYSEWAANYGNFNYVYIVDEYSADKTKDDGFQIYRLSKDDKYIKGEESLVKGDQITVKGYLQNYKGTIQVTYKDKDNPICVDMKQAERSDQDKVNAAKNSVKLDTERYLKLQEVDLPAESNGAALTWAVKGTTDLVTVADGKLNIVKLPDSGEVTVTLTVTIKCGTVTDQKDINIRVIKPADLSALTNDGTQSKPYTAADVKLIAGTLEDNDYYKGGEVDPKLVHITGYVVNKGTFNSSFNNFNNVYIADSASASQDEGILVYRIVTDSTYLKADGDLANGDKITITGFIQNYKGNTPEVTYNGNDNVTCVGLTKGEAPVVPPSTEGGVNIGEYATANKWSVGNDGSPNLTLNYDSNVTVTLSATATGSWGQNSGKYYADNVTGDGTGNWRIYQNENPKLTFTAVSGYKIVSIKVTYAVNKTGVLTNADKTTRYASDDLITVNASSVVLSVGNTSPTVPNGQVRITAIEIIYEAV